MQRSEMRRSSRQLRPVAEAQAMNNNEKAVREPKYVTKADLLKIVSEELSAVTGMSRQQRRKLERDLRKQRSRP